MVCVENDTKIKEAIDISIAQKVLYISMPFEEPLYETTSELECERYRFRKDTQSLSQDEVAEYATIWNQATKKLLLVGVNDPDALSESIIETLAADESVVVLTETTSNVHHPTFINTIDTLITPFTSEDFEDFRPEILVTFGGMIVSKGLKPFTKIQTKTPIRFSRAYDTFNALTKHFEVEPNLFFDVFYR
jgi:2-succinyl-5-enolpyruvyl-6-hydroxy-3-cyclohexene-1-carboxylate synthase